eukprot:scaffold1046_cov118-Isochrysis_galbana.AAC.6
MSRSIEKSWSPALGTPRMHRVAPCVALVRRARITPFCVWIVRGFRMDVRPIKKALLTSGDMAGLLCPPAVRTLPLPSPILSQSRFPYSGRYKRGMASELRALQQPGLEY